MVLSPLYEVGKMFDEAMYVVHRDLILVLESSCYNYYVSVTYCAGITRKYILNGSEEC